MSSKVASFFGESLSEVVFARKTELEENVDNWYAYLFSVVEKERKDLFYTMLENDGKIYPKNLVKFRNKFNDALGWLWINVFLAGDKSINGNTSFSNPEGEDVAEFAIKVDIPTLIGMNEQYKALIAQLEESGGKTINYEGFKYTKQDLLDAISDNNEDIKRLQKDAKRKAGNTSKPSKTRITGKTITPEKLEEEAAKSNINVDDVKRLSEITQWQRSDATGFINDTDFGRIYVQQRRDYIANVYTNETEKENMLGVFDKMNKQYEEGTASPPIQKYFERRYMRKDPQTGNVTIGNVGLETEPPIKIGGITLAGKRKSPTPYKNNDPLRELKLYEDVRKNMGKTISDGRLRNIVKTEVVAAYNMGRLHQMYIGQVKFVRWVNDVENRKEGKVCQICTIRAMGTSESLRRFAQKESLSGIYTIEDAFTNRQLAIPSHVNCLCQLRPINDAEEKALVAAGVFQTNMADTAAVIGGIAGAGLEGATNTQIAKEGTDISQWWYGALAAGGAAVAIGAMMFYLRKSLTSKYAAQIVKKQGVNVLEELDNQTIRSKRLNVTQNQLDESLKLIDDQKLDKEILQPLTDLTIRKKYMKDALQPLPELRDPLPDLSKLKNIDDLEFEYIKAVADKEYIKNYHQAIYDIATSPTSLERYMATKLESLDSNIDTLYEMYTNEPDLTKKRHLAEVLFINKENKELLVKVANVNANRNINSTHTRSRLTVDNFSNRFEDLLQQKERNGNRSINIGSEFLDEEYPNLKTYLSKNDIYNKRFDMDLEDYFSEGGERLQKTTKLSEILNELNAGGKVSRKRHKEIMKELRDIQNRDFIAEERLLETFTDPSNHFNNREGIPDFYNTLAHIYNEEPALLSDRLRVIAEDTLEKNRLTNAILGKLKKSYRQKLAENLVKDPFVLSETRTPKLVEKLTDEYVKRLAVETRRSVSNTLTIIIKELGKTNPNNMLLETYYTLKDFSLLLKKLEMNIETFKTLPNTEKKKVLQKLKKEIDVETRRIRDVEFTRYQQKWAMFGSPK